MKSGELTQELTAWPETCVLSYLTEIKPVQIFFLGSYIVSIPHLCRYTENGSLYTPVAICTGLQSETTGIDGSSVFYQFIRYSCIKCVILTFRQNYTWYLSIHVLQSGFIQQSHIVFDQNKFPRRQRNFTEFRITEFPHRLDCSIHIEDKLDSLVNAPIWFLLDKNRIAVQAIPFLSDRNRIGAVMRAPIWFLSNRNGIDL